ncbi:hypothetical protein G6F57_003689 [Rhizopus arrhizus]|uniref:LrgB-like protein n=1 Tax=Rhizopus oryzae TaxID=64495 RepID=A0A9P7BNG1_RHIOR|nr:hypothetical protein G6F21_003499 [Rhizopus arrhizus]KAG1418953.1 hypothetical protein G6F58_004844 [Rhizopus delemar]KAG0810417.1 hypothetical protein G6F20_007979 [Rhizopus arrhizus]KAG0835313.1 hypothetical protein G6F19_004769 [Rhizopus arrhizus]KAG0846425.1 hypothetical protein G6F18_000059 [Rhizopus arrhizus]
MYKSHLTEKTNQAIKSTSTFFIDQLPAYVHSLPSIKKHFIRWTSNVIYITVALLFNWAVSAVLRQMPNMHQFPSNVASLIVIYFLLMCSYALFPKYTDRFVRWIDTYSSFILKSMNIMFVPAVVQIVEDKPTTGSEVGRMACVFLVGYFCSFILTTLLVRGFRFILFTDYRHLFRKTKKGMDTESAKEAVSEAESIDMPSPTSTITSAYFSNPICYCPTEQKHGPLHAFALWCMKESNFDDLAMFLLFCLCGAVFLPLSESSPAMPFFRLFLYLFMTILMYSFFSKLPAGLRRFFHPIIVSAAGMMAGIAYFERCKGFDIKHGVDRYKTGITFISLVEKTRVGWPGAGDLLAATMDVAILSLSFNIYKSRPNQFRQWLVILCSLVPMAFLVMFVTPMFAHALGCTPADSLAWSSRSVTTAIGIVIGRVLGSSESVLTCLIIFTGIMGPIVGPLLLKLARVKDDDYMTIGIAMGSNSHGAGTAYLVTRNPKASGIASIAFAVFGVIGVIVASIPALSNIIKNSAGY